MRADGGSAEHPATPTQSQLLMLFPHHFTSLLFHQCYSANGARKHSVRTSYCTPTQPFVVVSSPASLEGKGLESTASSITQLFLSPASGEMRHPERSRKAAWPPLCTLFFTPFSADTVEYYRYQYCCKC